MTTEVKPFREVTPEGELILRFHEGQQKAWDSIARFLLVLAGTQSGKTIWGPHWMHRETLTAQEKLQRDEPLGDFIAATSTFDLFNQKMLPQMLEVFVRTLGIGYYWAGTKTLELREGLVPSGKFWAGPKSRASDPMWGRIILRSAEAESGLEASTAKAAWLDEVGMKEFTLDSWEAVLRRLSLYQGRVLGTSTLYNMGWLKTEWYDRAMAGDPNYEVVQFDSTMNPMFSVEEFEERRRTMAHWKFNMFYRGQYDKPAGLVYSNFDAAACVIDRFPIPDNWLWYTGHDFGGKNPATMVYAQDPGTSLFYAVYEYLPEEVGVYDQVDYLKTLLKGHTPIKRQGGSHQEVGWRGDYTSKGWPIAEPPVTGSDSVAIGIQRVWALHERNAIMVFRDLTRYLDEKARYSYKLGDGYAVMDEIENKSGFHLMDAERYILCGFHADIPAGTGPPLSTHSGTW